MPRVYPYTCRFCGETFKTRSALNLHKIAEHILETRANQKSNTGEGGVTWSRLTVASAATKPNMGHTWEIGVKWWTQIRRIHHEWDLKNMVDRSYVTDSWLLLSNKTIDTWERQGKLCFWLLQLPNQTIDIWKRRETWCLVAALAITPKPNHWHVRETWKVVSRGCSSCYTKPNHWQVGEKRNVVPRGRGCFSCTPNQTKSLTRGRDEKWSAWWLLQLSHQAKPLTRGREESCDVSELLHETKSLWHIGRRTRFKWSTTKPTQRR